jgi:hypothetical protein
MAIPEVIINSRPLAEAHPLDLALFVVFEEASVSIAETLTRQALPQPLLDLIARQVRDDSRHLPLFARRLDETLAVPRRDRGQATEALLLRTLQGVKAPAAPLQRDNLTNAVVIPPLRRYLDDCQRAADDGAVLDTLVLHNLLLKGMACSLYVHEVRYWQPFDPHLADIIRSVEDDEVHHVELAARMVRAALADDPVRRDQIRELCAEGYARLHPVFRYYIRKFVELFGVVARQQGMQFFETAEQEIAVIEANCAARYADTMAKSGITHHGHQESLSHP